MPTARCSSKDCNYSEDFKDVKDAPDFCVICASPMIHNFVKCPKCSNVRKKLIEVYCKKCATKYE